MATLSDSLVSATARSLRLKARPDLSARQHKYQGRTYWVVKEPVGLNYFRFQEEEYSILRMLDGHTSLDQLKAGFEAQFPPQKISVEELQSFIGMLHRSGLIVADVPGQGAQLKKRRDERWRKELLAKFTNILAIRFKGIDPDRLLTWMHGWLWWIFTPWAVGFCALLALSAGSLVMVQFDVFQSKLPSFHQFFTLKNALWLSVALGVTKIIHEFGHGLSCKHFGGECHEMGVMILVLTPCLYCNVSDSWMLPSKWKRAIIGAAGIYVEVVIASICTFLWWFSEPGMLHHLSLSTMFVCSISTILFNGNPLLRYDGYYILSDLVEIPNLRQKASDILNRKLGKWCLGMDTPDDPFLPERNQIFFALYSVAAAGYRWVVTFSILWFLYKVWEPYGLERIGQAIGIMALYGLLVQPLWKLGKFFYIPGRIEQVKKPRMYTTLGVLGVLLALFVFLPLPYRVHCTLNLEPSGARNVMVNVAGVLDEVLVRPGDIVKPNQELARLRNLDLELQVNELSSQVQMYKTQLDGLRRRAFEDKDAGLRIPAVEKTLASTEKQLRKKQTDLERLTLKAPVAGTVLPAQSVPERPVPEGELAEWSGTPFETKNLGAFMIESTQFCQVGNPKQMEAILVIDQSEIEFVEVGQGVQVLLEAFPHHIMRGKITEIAKVDLKVTPQELSNKAGGELATQTDASGIERPMSTSYQARVPLDNADELLLSGMRGKAKIHAPGQTLGQRLWRYITQTFHFKL